MTHNSKPKTDLLLQQEVLNRRLQRRAAVRLCPLGIFTSCRIGGLSSPQVNPMQHQPHTRCLDLPRPRRPWRPRRPAAGAAWRPARSAAARGTSPRSTPARMTKHMHVTSVHHRQQNAAYRRLKHTRTLKRCATSAGPAAMRRWKLASSRSVVGVVGVVGENGRVSVLIDPIHQRNPINSISTNQHPSTRPIHPFASRITHVRTHRACRGSTRGNAP